MRRTPPSVMQVLRELEPILTEIAQRRGSGEVAITYGNHKWRIIERPEIVHEGIPIEPDWGRVKVIETAET